MHTSMESCQSYWESKTGVQADKNVLLLVVRRVNKVCVWMALDFLPASSFSVFYGGWRSQMVGIYFPSGFTFSPLICPNTLHLRKRCDFLLCLNVNK